MKQNIIWTFRTIWLYSCQFALQMSNEPKREIWLNLQVCEKVILIALSSRPQEQFNKKLINPHSYPRRIGKNMMDKLNQSSNPRISISRTSPQNPKRMPDAFSKPRISQTSPQNPKNAKRTLKSQDNPVGSSKSRKCQMHSQIPKISRMSPKIQRKCHTYSQIPG